MLSLSSRPSLAPARPLPPTADQFVVTRGVRPKNQKSARRRSPAWNSASPTAAAPSLSLRRRSHASGLSAGLNSLPPRGRRDPSAGSGGASSRLHLAGGRSSQRPNSCFRCDRPLRVRRHPPSAGLGDEGFGYRPFPCAATDVAEDREPGRPCAQDANARLALVRDARARARQPAQQTQAVRRGEACSQNLMSPSCRILLSRRAGAARRVRARRARQLQRAVEGLLIAAVLDQRAGVRDVG